jgi:hypothetical protein
VTEQLVGKLVNSSVVEVARMLLCRIGLSMVRKLVNCAV